MKTHSLSSATSPGYNSPFVTSTTPAVSGMPKKSLTSTFTARNLALPTSPTPLPMHTAQYSNTAMRKGRRVTIDHDLDALSGTSAMYLATSDTWRQLTRAETSKVGMAKAIFESPEKNQAKSGVAGWTDSPKQRRP
jgi:centromeric protein E